MHKSLVDLLTHILAQWYSWSTTIFRPSSFVGSYLLTPPLRSPLCVKKYAYAICDSSWVEQLLSDSISCENMIIAQSWPVGRVFSSIPNQNLKVGKCIKSCKIFAAEFTWWGLDLNSESKRKSYSYYNSTSQGVLLFKMSHAADAFWSRNNCWKENVKLIHILDVIFWQISTFLEDSVAIIYAPGIIYIDEKPLLIKASYRSIDDSHRIF